MPVTKSAKKAMHRDRQRKKFNLLTEKAYKLALKEVRKKPTLATLAKVSQRLDRAAKKQVIHKNKAARLKSRLAKLINQTAQVKRKAIPSKKLTPKTRS